MKQSSIKKIFIITSLISESFTSCKSGLSGDLKVVGGSPATEGQFPATLWMRAPCTAVKVSARQILTAAHCLGGATPITPGSYLQIASDIAGLDQMTLRIQKVAVNPGYNPNLINPETISDLAIITLDSEIKNASIAALDLTPVKVGDLIILNGFGCEQDSHAPNNQNRRILKYVQTRVSKTYAASFSAPRNYLGKDARLCTGDSGGPVYKQSEQGPLKVVGINGLRNLKLPDEASWMTRIDANAPNNVAAWLRQQISQSSL